MADWMISVVESMGYVGLAGLMFLENVFPPLPSELIMPMGGFVAGRGDLSMVGVIAAGSAGSLAGQVPLYYLGRWLDEARLKRWLGKKRAKVLMVSADDIDRAMKWFDRWGRWAVLVCRFVPGIRSLISIPAGMNHMPLGRFLAFSAVGVVIWTAALALVGGWLGENYDKVGKYIGPVSYVVLGGLAVAAIVWAVRRSRGNGGDERDESARSAR